VSAPGPRIDAKIDPSPLAPLATALVTRLLPYLPDWVRPNQLTVLGCLAMVGAGAAMAAAGLDRRWFVVAVALTLLHWATDHLDGVLARSRALASERGFFLDLFLDQVGLTALLIGIGLASYATLAIFLAYVVLIMLRNLLLLHWLLLRHLFIIPFPGPAEVPFLVAAVAGLTWWYDGPIVTLAGRGLGWIDSAGLVLIALLAADLLWSFLRLAANLRPPEAPR
jgi:phosphatidylglycerophosphate synthase